MAVAARPNRRQRRLPALTENALVRESRVHAAGIRLSVRDHEGGDPPLVALHGLASNARWWDLVAQRLAPRTRVLALDLRGHGRSDRPNSGYDLASVEEDVAAALATLGVGPHVVAGHSWGASVALRHAARDGVLGCVCVDGGAADLRAVFGGTWEDAAPLMTPPSFSGITAAAVRDWAARSPLAEGSDPATAAEILLGNFEEVDGELRPRLSLENHMLIARDLFETSAADLLAQVRCPVLLVPAAQPEEQAPRRQAGVAAATAQLDGRATVRWVDGGHDLPVQRPAEVAAAIRGWLDDVVTEGSQPSTTS
ncbi:MAG: alpha/beta fold hydrolase [Candidatus Dormibacteria bacterium]